MRRRNLIVSDEVQLALLMRVTMHWLLFMIANGAALIIWITLMEMPTETFATQLSEFLRIMVPMSICSLVVVPIFIYDISKLSNQFAGPVLKMRRSLTSFLESGRVEPLSIRRGYFWQKFASDFNVLLARSSSSADVAPNTLNETHAYPEGK